MNSNILEFNTLQKDQWFECQNGHFSIYQECPKCMDNDYSIIFWRKWCGIFEIIYNIYWKYNFHLISDKNKIIYIY